MSNLIYSLEGGVANKLEVYEDRCVLVAIKNARSLLMGAILNGNKEFYYSDLTSVQFKPANSIINGYVQFEYPGSHSGGSGLNNFSSENSFAFMKAKVSNEDVEKAVGYIKEKIREAKAPRPAQVVTQAQSGADELFKYKSLLDAGVISQEEFDAKKKQILGL